MGSIQHKRSKTGSKVYYVVEPIGDKRKWIKAGSLKDAQKLKRQLESLGKSQRIEKLGLTISSIKIDEFFQRFADHVRLYNTPATVKRYLGVLNTL